MHVFCGDGEARGEARPAVKRRSLSRSLLLLQDLNAQLFVRSESPQAANNNPFPRQCLHMQTRVPPQQKRGERKSFSFIGLGFFALPYLLAARETRVSSNCTLFYSRQRSVPRPTYMVGRQHEFWQSIRPAGGRSHRQGISSFFVCVPMPTSLSHILKCSPHIYFLFARHSTGDD